MKWTMCYHMFSAFHQTFIYDLAGIVLARLNMNRLLYDSISTTPKRFTCPILMQGDQRSKGIQKDRTRTWQGTVVGIDCCERGGRGGGGCCIK